MKNKPIFLTLIVLLCCNFSNGQSISTLKEKINEILIGKDATVGIAISGVNPNDSLSINGNKKLPLQSVFKYHLALAVLNQVDKGNFNLNDKITITKENLKTATIS